MQKIKMLFFVIVGVLMVAVMNVEAQIDSAILQRFPSEKVFDADELLPGVFDYTSPKGKILAKDLKTSSISKLKLYGKWVAIKVGADATHMKFTYDRTVDAKILAYKDGEAAYLEMNGKMYAIRVKSSP